MVQKALTTDMLRRPTVDDLLADAWLSAHREEVHAGALGGISWDSISKIFCFYSYCCKIIMVGNGTFQKKEDFL